MPATLILSATAMGLVLVVLALVVVGIPSLSNSLETQE